ncbi:MAG: FKBP-type peptidyl-prolyl cis-trans isomerase [Flavobacteriales bacterium]|nr:FKBP-type peptidyl-prolyl cis-trans isomerase [Flavobacteriales bacterium]
MKNTLLLLTVAALLGSCNAQTDKKEVSLLTFNDSVSYALGSSIGVNLMGDFKSQGIDSSFSSDLVIAGISDAIYGDSAKVSDKESRKLVETFFNDLNKQRLQKNLAVGEVFLKDNGSKAGVITTESGLQYIVLKEGEGDSPTTADQVRVHYTGKLLNGKVFDSSVERNEPVVFFVRAVIPGWTEALQLMKPGAEYKLFIPSALAYGERGGPKGSGIGPNEVLIFDVKLIDIIKE